MRMAKVEKSCLLMQSFWLPRPFQFMTKFSVHLKMFPTLTLILNTVAVNTLQSWSQDCSYLSGWVKMNLVEVAMFASSRPVMMMMRFSSIASAYSASTSWCHPINISTLLLCVLLIRVRVCQRYRSRSVLRVRVCYVVRIVEWILATKNKLQSSWDFGVDWWWQGD